MNKTISISFALAVSALVSNQAAAAVPDLIPVQGVLSDSAGAPIDALTDITFSLYGQESGGTAVWTDTFTDVDVVDGFFSVYLGSDDPLDFSTLLGNSEIWLGMSVEADPEMNRVRLAAVPFAVEAQVCSQVGSLTEEDINDNFLSSGAPAASITSTDIGYWNTAYGWGDHAEAGYLTDFTEADPVFGASDAASITSTDIGYWDAAYSWGDHAGLYAAVDHDHDTAYAALSHTHAASDVTSGTFDNARVNWAAPDGIGSTTRASGAFTSLAANNGLSVTNGTVVIMPSGSGGTSGQVLTNSGSGVATWQTPASAGSLSVTTQNSAYTILPTDGFIITNGGVTFTFPTAASAGAGKILYLYSKVASITLLPAVGNTIWDAAGNSHTNPSTFTSFNGVYVSDGVSTWFEIAK